MPRTRRRGNSTDSVSVIFDMAEVYKANMKKTSTSTKELGEMNPLIWKSFRVEMNLVSPLEACQMTTLELDVNSREIVFARDLNPESFLWNGSVVYFLHLGILSPFWILPDGVTKLRCPHCREHTLKSSGWAQTMRRVCSEDSRPTFLCYSQHECTTCASKLVMCCAVLIFGRECRLDMPIECPPPPSPPPPFGLPRIAGNGGAKKMVYAHDLMDQMQPIVHSFFGLHFTRKGVVTTSLLNSLTRASTKGQSFSDIRNMRVEAGNALFYQNELDYYEIAAMRQAVLRKAAAKPRADLVKELLEKQPAALARKAARSVQTVHGQPKISGFCAPVATPGPSTPQAPPPSAYKLPNPDEPPTAYFPKEACPTWFPCEEYFTGRYIDSRCDVLPGASHSQAEYERLSMTRIGGKILKNDNNFVLTKFIRSRFECVNTMLNEYGQVVWRYLLPSNSLKCLQTAGSLFQQRTVYKEVRSFILRHACHSGC